MANIRLDGADELMQRVKAMGKDATEASTEGLKKGTDILLREAKANAPLSAHHRKRYGATGHLKNVLVSKIQASRLEAGVTVRGGANGKYYYWRYPEYGTVRQKKQGYIAKSVEDKGDEAIKVVKDAIVKKLGLK